VEIRYLQPLLLLAVEVVDNLTDRVQVLPVVPAVQAAVVVQ
jgi:hypothetical protein